MGGVCSARGERPPRCSRTVGKKTKQKNTVVETDSLQNVAVLLPTAAMRESGRQKAEEMPLAACQDKDEEVIRA